MTDNRREDRGADAARAVRDHVAAALPRWLALMADMVAIDSGPDAPQGIAEVQQLLGAALRPLAAAVSQCWVDGVPHLRASIPGSGPVVALVGHADTVFAAGTAGHRPMTISGSRLEGPGTADMKGGLAMAAAVVAGLQGCAIPHPTLEILVYGDEETRKVAPPDLGGPRPDACLVLECGRPGGGFVTGRKAGGWVTVQATGSEAHAGVDPDRGRNAIVALSQAVLAITDLHRSRRGVSVSVGLIAGGSAINTVPAHAQAQVDIRALRTADLEAVLAALHDRIDHPVAAIPADPDHHSPAGAARVAVTHVERWPAVEAAPGADLAERYQHASAAVDLPAVPVSTGGTSDGAWFAEAGVPTIDGLGPIGGLDHSPQEHLDLDSFAPRAGALAGLLRSLTR